MSAKHRSRRRELVESIAQGAVLLSDEGRVLAINDAARELLAIPEGARTRTAADVLTHPALADAADDVRDAGEPMTLEFDHAEARLRVNISMLRDEVLVLITDRTEEHRVEELRRDFVVNASHELKTPVTGIQALADALSVVSEQQPERVPELAAQLGDEAARLAALVHDLLDLRRLEERGPLDRTSVDLAELVRRVVAAQVDRAEQLEVELSVDAPAGVEIASVAGDLEVVVRNLVRNAISYNRPGGTVDITLRSVGDGEDTTELELVVADTGMGIDPAELPRIFERFYRVDPARSHHTGGTGLGLSIVRHAVEHLGGSIEVDSQPGDGTCFTVRLPTERPD
ncbi:MAG: ATP-binding protein [Nitriliruptoraceae bacterium]